MMNIRLDPRTTLSGQARRQEVGKNPLLSRGIYRIAGCRSKYCAEWLTFTGLFQRSVSFAILTNETADWLKQEVSNSDQLFIAGVGDHDV